MGQNRETTAIFGNTVENSILATSHTIICDLIVGPTIESTFRAIRRSSPVDFHGIVSRQEPKIKIILSEKYLEVTLSIGIILNNAFAIIGTNAVTVMFTGWVTHQKIIQINTPIASAPASERVF